jgi:hypothetical protein
VTPGSARLSVGSRVGRGRAYLDGETIGGRRGEAEGPRERAAVGVRLATRDALPAGRGRQDARVRQAERVAAPRTQPLAVRGPSASFRAPQAGAREAWIAGTGLCAGVADSQLTADGALRVEARRQRVEEAHPVGRLTLAVGCAPCRAGASLLAPEEVLAVGAPRARFERRTATRARALGALSVVGADPADVRARPGVFPSPGTAAARDPPRAGRAVAVAAAEVWRDRRSGGASRQDRPCQAGGKGDGGPVHSSIEAPRRARNIAARPDRATPRRKPGFSRGLANRPPERTALEGASGVVPFASHA